MPPSAYVHIGRGGALAARLRCPSLTAAWRLDFYSGHLCHGRRKVALAAGPEELDHNPGVGRVGGGWVGATATARACHAQRVPGEGFEVHRRQWRGDDGRDHGAAAVLVPDLLRRCRVWLRGPATPRSPAPASPPGGFPAAQVADALVGFCGSNLHQRAVTGSSQHFLRTSSALPQPVSHFLRTSSALPQPVSLHQRPVLILTNFCGSNTAAVWRPAAIHCFWLAQGRQIVLEQVLGRATIYSSVNHCCSSS
jgi:hypothetical protein